MEKITANVARKRVEVEFEGNYSGDVAGFAEKLKTSAPRGKSRGQPFRYIVGLHPIACAASANAG